MIYYQKWFVVYCLVLNVEQNVSKMSPVCFVFVFALFCVWGVCGYVGECACGGVWGRVGVGEFVCGCVGVFFLFPFLFFFVLFYFCFALYCFVLFFFVFVLF